jgi:hypothetical protein
MWMVGDSIFPGQSVPAVALGGMRVAKSILAELGYEPVAAGELDGGNVIPSGRPGKSASHVATD